MKHDLKDTVGGIFSKIRYVSRFYIYEHDVKRLTPGESGSVVIVQDAPESLRAIVQKYHDTVLVAHRGLNALWDQIKRSGYYPS